MPAQRPRASFEPIPPDFNLKALVESTSNFTYVDRISCDMIDQQGIAAFEKLILLHVIIGGKPLVIDGFEDRLDPWTFTPKWLRDNCGEKQENAWDLKSKEVLPLTIAHYLDNMPMLANQFFSAPDAYRDRKRQKVYLKDIDSPLVWQDKLKEHIPSSLYYLNESTGEVGGPGSVPETNSQRLGKGIGRAGDLMSSLPQDMRAENLMCYIGHEGTFTPAHREMCASLGHNIMVEASGNVSEDGKPERPGSSIWFMTESKDRHTVSEYWLSVLGHDIEVENHFAQIVAWKKAPFQVYVVEQRPGDFILIPPLAPHQVWNRGTRTMKVAWNRTTVETLEMALNEALPRSRIVCRDEQYKNKAIVYYTLQKYSGLLTLAQSQSAGMPSQEAAKFLYSGKIKQLAKDFRKLFTLYREILLSEMFNPDERDAPKSIEYLPFDGNVTCAYCRSNIFNRFLSCPSCKDILGHATDPEGDPYDVCMDCYAMGRSCACLSGLKWVEQFRWKELALKYETWRKLIIALDGGQITDKTPLTIVDERRRYPKKTLAEVCKEQLRRRPFKEVHKTASGPAANEDEEDEGEEIVVNDDGSVKKVQKKKSKTWLKNNSTCHVCKHPHPNWKMAQCTACDRWWCYGTLFRGWDKMPMDVMSDPAWTCPHCLGICFAGSCKASMEPYEPKGTLLGHDTRKVADVRSVEALVDFSVSNISWLRDDDPADRTTSRRIRRAGEEAEIAKAMDLNAHDEDGDDAQHDHDSGEPATFIDPALYGSTMDENGAQLDDAELARRLEEANATLPDRSSTFAPVNGHYGHGNTEDTPRSRKRAAERADFASYNGSYPQPEEQSSYAYPGYMGQMNVDPDLDEEPAAQPSSKRARARSRSNSFDDIAMTKGSRPAKKPRLIANGFRSYDLAKDGTPTSKSKNEAQRQFEREKERKALEKAKAEGRFIMLQAALKGKKRIVKMNISGPRLAQLVAQHAAQAALGMEDAEHERIDSEVLADDDMEEEEDIVVLKSDIPAPKKPFENWRQKLEQRQKEGDVITSTSKKARIPVEKDSTYSDRSHNREPNKFSSAVVGSHKRKGRQRNVDFEEVDIGSDDEDDENLYGGSGTARDRRSLPGYRARNRHAEDDDDADFPDELPDNFREGGNRPRRPAASAPSSAWKVAGKRPSMRPAPTENAADNEVEEVVAQEPTPESSVTPVPARSPGRPQSLISQTITAAKQATTASSPVATIPKRGRPKKAVGRPHQGSVLRPAISAGTVEEDNRLAKLQALEMYSNDFNVTATPRAVPK